MRTKRRFMPYVVVCAILYSAPASVMADDDVVPLMAGTPAPFSGLLYPESAAAQSVSDAIELEHLEFKIERLDLYIKEQDGIYKKALDEAANQSWYQSPELNRWVGIVLGVGLALGIVAGVSAVRK